MGRKSPRGRPGPPSIVGIITALIGALQYVSEPINKTLIIIGILIIVVDFAIEYEW